MNVQLFVAPAGTGKTTYVMNLAREAAQGLGSIPRVIVPTQLQVRAWRHRLAEAGGAIGIRVLTYDRLYADCLNAAGEVYTELSEPVRHRLIRATVDELPLEHYMPLTNRPGFIQVLQQLIGELKAGMIFPELFSDAVAAIGGEPRLDELAKIYAAYQARLQANNWADRTGLGWLAVEALAERAPDVARDWPLLVFDNFDNLTPVQLELIKVLAGRARSIVVTLTGMARANQRVLAHRRFDETRCQLEEALGVKAVPLPERDLRHAPVLIHLEANLFQGGDAQVDGQGTVHLVEASNRDGEVRAAMRWLKARMVHDGIRPAALALLARSIPPYRPFILQTAAEFGLPIRLMDGLPLRTNPSIVALLDLLRLMLPAAGDASEPSLPRRLVVEAWRSPYFDWEALPSDGALEPIGITPRDADKLDIVARWGRIVRGLLQWEEVLDDLCQVGTADPETLSGQDEERGFPPNVPVEEDARELRAKFQRFVQRMTPPSAEQPFRTFVGWLEALIGPDPQLRPAAEEPTTLRVVERAHFAEEESAERDVAALQALKDVLRGLVWAEDALGAKSVTYPRFFDELVGAVEAATYRMPIRPHREEILVTDVIRARGIPFQAVALLGLAEGEFPTTLSEDPFLRDADRMALRHELGLRLELSTESAEAEFFYETVTRPRERLLLTRPRLADNGAPWQASPFWEEVLRVVRVEPVRLIGESIPKPEQVASWPELVGSIAAHDNVGWARDWLRDQEPALDTALERTVRLLHLRQRGATRSSFDGDLGEMVETFGARFGPQQSWSASRLESYRACPFSFFVGSVLGLEPRFEPAEGLDARQLGNIYHRVFEMLYQSKDVADPSDVDQLLNVLDAVAGQILDQAPEREGFRETAWWAQTRLEIVENVRHSLQALAELPGDFIPYRHEAVFGLRALVTS